MRMSRCLLPEQFVITIGDEVRDAERKCEGTAKGIRRWRGTLTGDPRHYSAGYTFHGLASRTILDV